MWAITTLYGGDLPASRYHLQSTRATATSSSVRGAARHETPLTSTSRLCVPELMTLQYSL